MSDKRARPNEGRDPSYPHFRSESTANKPLRLARGVEFVAALTLWLYTPALAADSVKINDLIVAAPIPDAQHEATMKAVRAFYNFWNTGDEALLKDAIAPSFTTPPLLPGGRQGP